MKLFELQQTFNEMTTQLKELDNCVPADKNVDVVFVARGLPAQRNIN